MVKLKNGVNEAGFDLGGRCDFRPGSLHGIETSMRHVPVMMTKPLADELLSRLHPRQRPLKRRRVERYKRDLRAGRWELIPDPVCVDEDGLVVNARNRLTAVSEANLPMPLYICYGVPRTALRFLDGGAARTAFDAAVIEGAGVPTSSHVTVARAVLEGVGPDNQNWTSAELVDAVEAYREGLDFAFSLLPPRFKPKAVTVTPVRAVLARAHYNLGRYGHGARDRCGQFAGVLGDGLPRGAVREDASAVFLRNWLIEHWGVHAGGVKGRRLKADAYALTQSALDSYLRREDVKALRKPGKDLFAVPAVYQTDG